MSFLQIELKWTKVGITSLQLQMSRLSTRELNSNRILRSGHLLVDRYGNASYHDESLDPIFLVGQSPKLT